MLDHEVANATDSFAARRKAFARVFVHHQVNIALTVFDFLIGYTMELVGHRAQALGEHANTGGMQ